MFVLTILLILSPTTLSYNILLTVPFGGSHLALTSHFAQILSDNGHVAVIATPERDAMIPTGHTLITPTLGGFSKRERFVISEDCMRKVLRGKTELSTVVYIGEDCRRETWAKILELSSEFFLGEQLRKKILELDIQVIIADDANIGDLGKLAADLNIPLICNIPWNNHFRAREEGGYPQLLSIEPSHMWPDLLDSGFTLTGYVRAYMNYQKLVTYSKGREGRTVDDEADVYVVNDVSYFSYPYVTPPNLYLVGGIYLSPQVNSLDNTEFSYIYDSEYVVYLSFGSYAIPEWLPWLSTVFEALDSSEATAVIAKINGDPSNLVSKTSKKFHFKTWLPQKDLLGSGRVKLFISHCGQNSRIEAAYYGVPMLCVPLFGDQLLSSYLMQWNNFGVLLKREDIKMEKVRDLINRMLMNGPIFQNSIARARALFMDDPASKPDNFLFLVNTLGKNGRGAFRSSRNLRATRNSSELMGILLLSSAMCTILIYICRT